MKIFHSIVLYLLLLGACVAPEPTSQVTFQQQMENDLDAGATIALSVDSAAEKPGSSWSKNPEDFALDLERKLEFRLIESGLVHQIVDPGDDADHDMTVTITAFKHDVLGLPGEDDSRLNSVAADVTLIDRVGKLQLAAYDISAAVGSEAAYSTQQSAAGLDALLDTAVQGVLEGLRGPAEDTES